MGSAMQLLAVVSRMVRRISILPIELPDPSFLLMEQRYLVCIY